MEWGKDIWAQLHFKKKDNPMSFMIDRFAPFQFSAFPTSVAPLSEKEEFEAKGRDLALANRVPLMQRLRLALLRMLPADRSRNAVARQRERQLLGEIKRLEELSSHLLSDIGYRRTSSGDYVLDIATSGKRQAADTPPGSNQFQPANAQRAALSAA